VSLDISQTYGTSWPVRWIALPLPLSVQALQNRSCLSCATTSYWYGPHRKRSSSVAPIIHHVNVFICEGVTQQGPCILIRNLFPSSKYCLQASRPGRFILWERTPPYPLGRRLCGPPETVWTMWRKFFALPVLKLQPLGHPPCSQSIYRLRLESRINFKVPILMSNVTALLEKCTGLSAEVLYSV
jgi:hypothetical protein